MPIIDTRENARRTDPATSHAAARSLDTDSITFLLLQAFATAPLHGLTSEEAGEIVNTWRGYYVEGVWKRVSDLLRMGYIEPQVHAHAVLCDARRARSGRLQRVHVITSAGLAVLAAHKAASA